MASIVILRLYLKLGIGSSRITGNLVRRFWKGFVRINEGGEEILDFMYNLLNLFGRENQTFSSKSEHYLLIR